MKRIVVINGQPQSGKDTFVELVTKFWGKEGVENIHTSNPAKLAFSLLGWDGRSKTPEERQVLAHLMSISENMYDGVFNYTVEAVQQTKSDSLVFIHCREPKNISRYVAYFGNRTNHSVCTVLVERGQPKEHLTENDNVVFGYKSYDRIISNNGTLEDLELSVKTFLTNIDK